MIIRPYGASGESDLRGDPRVAQTFLSAILFGQWQGMQSRLQARGTSSGVLHTPFFPLFCLFRAHILLRASGGETPWIWKRCLY